MKWWLKKNKLSSLYLLVFLHRNADVNQQNIFTVGFKMHHNVRRESRGICLERFGMKPCFGFPLLFNFWFHASINDGREEPILWIPLREPRV